MRYRVNYTLLVVLVVGVLVCSGGVYALWQFQVERNAGDMLVEAEAAEKRGEYRSAGQYLRNYLQVRPDDREVEIRHANLMADIGENKHKLEDWAAKDYAIARTAMDTALRMYPDEDKLRRRQVDLTLKAGTSLLKDAISHIDILLNNNPDDAELKRMRSVCLFQAGDTEKARDYAYKLIGYDPQTDTFDASKAGAPGEEVVYRNVANLLRGSERLPELAERVMNQLVEANPEKPAAYLQRAEFRLGLDEREDDAKADLQKAIELAPKDADVLAANAEFRLRQMQDDLQERREEDPDAAPAEEAIAECRQLLETGVAEHPTDMRFYQSLARLELAQKDYQASMQHLELGLSKIDENLRVFLMLFMADLQLGEQDLVGARETAAEVRQSNFNPRLADYIEARCRLIEERWFEAHRMLEEVKPAFEQSPSMITQINFQLGLCQERLGRLDQAVDLYELALSVDPNNAPAAAGIERVRNMQGVEPEGDTDQSLTRRLALVLQQPKDEQDWPAFDKVVEQYAKKMKLPPSGVQLLKVEILMRRGEFEAARELLQTAYRSDPDNINVRRAAMKLVATDPEQGPTKALQLLHGIVDKFGDSPQLRLDKADLLIQTSSVSAETPADGPLESEPVGVDREAATAPSAQSDAELIDNLMALTEGISEWTSPQQVQLWSGLGGKFAQMRLRDEAETCWKKVAELAPGDLATRVMLFKMAREENDDAGMKAAQEDILEIVGSKDDTNYLYSEAQRLMSLANRGLAGDEAVQQADDLVAKALVERRDWNELHLLRAEIELRRGNESAALENYDRAMKLGRAAPGNVLQYAQLLIRRGRWVDAREALEMLDTAVRQRVLGQLYAEVLLNTGSPEEALQTAEVVIEADPENPSKQLWYGQFILRTFPADKKFEIKSASNPAEGSAEETLTIESEELDAAEREALAAKIAKSGKALAKTVELAPSSPESWLPWVGYLVSTKQLDRAAEAIRQAQLALPEDQQQLLLARCYEITGRWFDAENLYRAAVENNPDNVHAKRLLAAYYLGSGYPLQANKQERATPLINGILQAAAENKTEPGDENVLWARRTAADMLAATGDYQNLLKAENLLASNAIGGELAVEDQLRMAQILAPRPEPISKAKALHLLADVKRNQRLTPMAELVLGQLYFANDDWQNARSLMTELIARNPAEEGPRVAYMRMLLERGGNADISEATRQLDRLLEYAPGSTHTMELVVMMAIKTGKENEARQALRRLLPSNLNEVDEKTLPVVGRVAELITQLKDYDEAETLYRFIAAKQPQFVPALASFLGIHRDPEKCFELLDKLEGNMSPPVLIQSALAVIRERREDFGEKYDARVQTWLDRALRDDPESITLLLQQSELHDLQGEYDKAAEIYRGLLERQDLEGQARAIVLNNLAFLLALGGDKEATSGEALQLVQDAIYILGPTADILDTRAMVFLAQKQHSEAIADLELAVKGKPSPSSLYHLALAHLAANQTDDAVQVWNRAVDRGLTRDSLNRMEWDQFEKTKEQLENPEARSASL